MRSVAWRIVALAGLLLAGACSTGPPAVGQTPAGGVVTPVSGVTTGPVVTATAVRGAGTGVVVTPVAGQARGTPVGGAVVYMGVMVHVEGWPDDRERAAFERHAGLVDRYASLFERYGARLTVESNEVFVRASRTWGSTLLSDLEKRGHGIGLHADLGGEQGLTQAAFVTRLKQMKANLEALGPKVRHVSGICSPLDWVKAALDAGFEFNTGGVAYCLKAVPAGQLPKEYEFVNRCRTPAECHQVVPTDLAQRIHPWTVASAATWLQPASEGLVFFPSGGGIICGEEEQGGRIAGGCTLTEKDIQIHLEELKRVLANASPTQLNTYYVSWSIGAEVDDRLVEQWLAAVKPYVDDGRVQWRTIPQMYDAYLTGKAR